MLHNYRVDGTDLYQIDFQPQTNGTFKLFAPSHPDDPHGAPYAETHLHSSSGEICIAAGHEPRTMDRAKAIAVHWMESYSEYLRTGVFPQGGRRVSV